MEQKPLALFSSQAVEVLYKKIKSSEDGLSDAEAAKRLKDLGRNEVHSATLSWWHILVRQFKSPFLYLLIAAAILASFLGEKTDALMIGLFVAIDVLIGFCQEYHSEKAVSLLKKFVSSKTVVRRSGQEFLVDSRDLVPGDIVIVRTGDRIQVDLRWLETENLQVDESVLTGESVVVEKNCQPLKEGAKDFFAAKNIGFCGTLVASGRGVGLVFATGANAEFGKIAKMTAGTDSQGTFQKGIAEFSSFILRVILITLAIVFIANVLIKGFETDIAELLIFSVALAVSVIPEALPVVTTMTLSRGALRLAKKKVVAKRLSAIEDLGSIDILCTDKTGTVTENKMAVAEIFSDDREKCLWYAGLASASVDFKVSPLRSNFDGALLSSFSKMQCDKACQMVREYERPFDPIKRWNSVVINEDKNKILIVRGAPEGILPFCKISKKEEVQVMKTVEQEGKKGRRVLALATKEKIKSDVLPEDGGLVFLGLISFDDPIKATAKAAIAESERLGLRVKILSGDGPEVAGAVGYEIGLIKSPDRVVIGEDWLKLSETERLKVAESEDVFARVTPEQKFLIIQTLQKKFEVGFLGDGINDAPALKVADVGLVVDGAADIAREAADLVLLEHGLEVIISGIKEGREVFANTVKYIKSTLISNFGNFVAVASATLLVNYLPMLPIQILLLNLLSDFPMIAIAMDSVDPDELKRPRHYSVKEVAYVAVALGLISTVFDFIFFALFSRISPEVLWTNWFIASVLTELALTMSIRTKKPFYKAKAPAPILSFLTLAGVIIAIVVPFTAIGRNLFHFVQPTNSALFMIIGLVLLYFALTEIAKHFYYRFQKIKE
jgi:Mg2+-importing ATPase